MGIVYAREQDLPAEDYIAVVGSTYMREKRPLANRERVNAMLRGSNFIVSARDGGNGDLLALARGMTDGEWVCYIADLVVRDGHQGSGIGKALLDECSRILGPGIGLVLVAYPPAEPFYRRIGMEETVAFFRPRTVST